MNASSALSAPTATRRLGGSALTVTAIGVCALLGLLDVAGTAGLFADDGPPWWIVVPGTVLGLLTLAATLPALRGSGPALLTVVGTRLVSAVMGFVVFFDESAPHWAEVTVAIAIAVTMTAFALLVADGTEPRRERG